MVEIFLFLGAQNRNQGKQREKEQGRNREGTRKEQRRNKEDTEKEQEKNRERTRKGQRKSKK